MKIALENIAPRDIERRSFEIITQELGDTPLIPGTEPIVKRCIHTSADFDYAQNLRFSQNVVAQALRRKHHHGYQDGCLRHQSDCPGALWR